MIVAIDGPSGAGKSTVATRVARALHFQLIDTGALYRTLTYRAKKGGIDLKDERAVSEFAKGLRFQFRWEGEDNVLLCNDEVVGSEIRTEDVSSLTSKVSSMAKVRDSLLEIQRRMGRTQSSVLEGRDIGSVVFPDAEVKVYLTASAEERAQRRLDQARGRGEELDYEEVKRAIEERDRRDSERSIAPLKCASDAVRIDSTKLTIDEVVEKILSMVSVVSGG